MPRPSDFEVIRDPLWNNIRVDREALAVLDTEPFQRLRYIRQLGHAYLVYPGATHTRFEHALGTYHLARRTLALLQERDGQEGVDPGEITAIRLAALLHDIGHYPFSHALEEAGLPSHEILAPKHFEHPELHDALAAVDVPHLSERLGNLINGTSDSPLQGLISGSLDLDKIEYLTRDARMCGVPYGTVDVDRLMHSLAIVTLPDGSRTVGVHEKGLSALESLLFAKYQMYRNVYWHHAVRSATVMFKRLIREAIASGYLEPETIPWSTDEELMEKLRRLPGSRLTQRLRQRRLYKRALDLPVRELPAIHHDWVATDPDLAARVENRLAVELGVEPGEILLDYPTKPEMLAADLPILTRDGKMQRLIGEGGMSLLGIQQVSDELHTIAQRLRVFVAYPIEVSKAAVLALIERTGAEMETELKEGTTLLNAAG